MKYVDATGAPLSNASGDLTEAGTQARNDAWYNTITDMAGDAQGQLLQEARYGTAHEEGLGGRLLKEQGRSMLGHATGLYNPGTKFIYNLGAMAAQSKQRKTFATNFEEEGSDAMDLS